jgi:hypothetical protein
MEIKREKSGAHALQLQNEKQQQKSG